MKTRVYLEMLKDLGSRRFQSATASSPRHGREGDLTICVVFDGGTSKRMKDE